MPDVSHLRNLVDKRRIRDASKAAADLDEKEFRAAEQIVWSEWETSGQTSGKFDLGPGYGTVRFDRKKTIRGRVLNLDDALDFLENSARSDEMTKVDVRKKQLNEFVRGEIEAGRPLPKGLDWRETKYMSMSGGGIIEDSANVNESDAEEHENE